MELPEVPPGFRWKVRKSYSDPLMPVVLLQQRRGLFFWFTVESMHAVRALSTKNGGSYEERVQKAARWALEKHHKNIELQAYIDKVIGTYGT